MQPRTTRVKFLVVFTVILIVTNSCYGFNIDLNTHVEYKRPPETLFGFSVAAHEEANKGW